MAKEFNSFIFPIIFLVSLFLWIWNSFFRVLFLQKIGGFELGFWFSQQGSIYVFIILIFTYSYLVERLEKKKRNNMEAQTLTYIFVGLSFALYIGIAIASRAKSTNDFYVAGKG